MSVTSAASIFKHIDRRKFEPVAIKIEKDGRWVLPDQPPQALTAAEIIQQARTSAVQARALGGGEPAALVRTTVAAFSVAALMGIADIDPRINVGDGDACISWMSTGEEPDPALPEATRILRSVRDRLVVE